MYWIIIKYIHMYNFDSLKISLTQVLSMKQMLKLYLLWVKRLLTTPNNLKKWAAQAQHPESTSSCLPYVEVNIAVRVSAQEEGEGRDERRNIGRKKKSNYLFRPQKLVQILALEGNNENWYKFKWYLKKMSILKN